MVAVCLSNLHIWMIVGVIIYLSRHSTTIVKLVGSSAVSVLATLFLPSYTKLQRTVITAFSFTYLQNYHENGRSLAVWLYVQWECPFSPRDTHSFVPDGPDCHSVFILPLLCCIWVTGIMYKTTALSILEASFILNLLILSGSTIYNRDASNGDSSDGQTALVCTNCKYWSRFQHLHLHHVVPYLPLP